MMSGVTPKPQDPRETVAVRKRCGFGVIPDIQFYLRHSIEYDAVANQKSP
jgi:hypothetical protein